MRGILGLLADRMKPNGSAYVFASPQMAGRVETVTWERLNVLGALCGARDASLRARQGAAMAPKEALRTYFPMTERVIFAEHYGSDAVAMGKPDTAANATRPPATLSGGTSPLPVQRMG